MTFSIKPRVFKLPERLVIVIVMLAFLYIPICRIVDDVTILMEGNPIMFQVYSHRISFAGVEIIGINTTEPDSIIKINTGLYFLTKNRKQYRVLELGHTMKLEISIIPEILIILCMAIGWIGIIFIFMARQRKMRTGESKCYTY